MTPARCFEKLVRFGGTFERVELRGDVDVGGSQKLAGQPASVAVIGGSADLLLFSFWYERNRLLS